MSGTVNDELLWAGPVTLAEMVRSRVVKPRELVELSLRRIEALDSRLNAFRVMLAEEALAAAEAIGDHGGPLAGVPIAIKDNFRVGGQAMTMGSRSYGAPAGRDAESVRRLRAAGAIPIGITNVPELMIFPWTASDANGLTRNPWELTRTPGGSSGGSAAAVAAGLVPCATASDGGGSIRIPSAYCGLVGMKASRGRVSADGENDWLGLSVFGALARTVRDSALLLDVMHGVLPGERYRAPTFSGSYLEAASRPPSRLRIAVSAKLPPLMLAKVSDDQRGALERTRDLLAGLGHEVVERDPAYGSVALEFTQFWLRGIYETTLEVPDPSRLEAPSRRLAAAGRSLVPAWRRARLLRRRDRTIERVTALWREVDVLLTPAVPASAGAAEGGYGRPTPIAVERASRCIPWTAPFNVTGQPALVLPAGFDADGLPLSVQLVGRVGAEDTLYALAGQLEEARPWAGYLPPLASDS